jgi:site-specific recombinase XerD
MTVQEFSLNWLESRKLAGKPLGSWESDETRLRKYILPHFGHRELNRISTKEWESYLDSLVSDDLIAPATRNRIRSLATKMYNDALRSEIVANNPVRVIPKLKEAMEAWDYWASVDDICAYLEEAKKESEWFFNFACLSLNLGLRLGESIALDFEDVNLSHRRIHITKVFEEASGQVFRRTKGHKERWLGINDSVFEALMEYRAKAKFVKSSDPIICDENGQRIRERKMRHVHDKVCERAKVKPIRPHDLRHTYASHYIMNGGSLIELQSLLGHSSPSMTLKYAHLAPGFLEKKAGMVSFAAPKQNVTPIRMVR